MRHTRFVAVATAVLLAVSFAVAAPEAGAKPKPPPPPPQSIPFTVCTAGSTPLTVTQITGDPWPPQKGQRFDLTLTGTVSEQLTVGSDVVVDISFLGVPIANETIPLEQLTPLPTGPGPVSLTDQVDIPSITPSGTYTVRLDFHDQTAAQIGCVSFDVVLS